MNEVPSSPQLQRLLAIMARLRDPQSGCEWDLAQDFASIAPYTIEEAYEVADAIERGDMVELRDELGDLLLQVVFHARMAEEAGLFAFDDVARSISDKMEARHPHIFGGEGGTMGETRWENLKQAERAEKGMASALDGVALALPALMRAQKLQKRAARTGFDWPDPKGSEAKIIEEIEELNTASSQEDKVEEAGDLLFAAVNFVRAHGIAAEDALRAANAKFERRFRAMESRAGDAFAELSLDQQEALWQEVKRDEETV
ncbi:nucleoside triphosphate pyrophosphohydrolase [Erythrobacter sp. HL-111]|uniref:nucleoside triphosphate pyrophosphohydrolase n=1 Tax=Erythrobacter sp. HL-111 TaxID=1798193 RepID=UPI0006DA1DCD|nr:nucleoside triphosphate pyrophosphohydrolase [Erythrobacter sp. HL-111]KPP85442.1 MAG: ATP diphosphatase MazG [Erythrobacteraceae bacterium HL-111]SDR96766.1 ATP diphosphatase [Erythrobacter sp. HL-111]